MSRLDDIEKRIATLEKRGVRMHDRIGALERASEGLADGISRAREYSDTLNNLTGNIVDRLMEVVEAQRRIAVVATGTEHRFNRFKWLVAGVLSALPSAFYTKRVSNTIEAAIDYRAAQFGGIVALLLHRGNWE